MTRTKKAPKKDKNIKDSEKCKSGQDGQKSTLKQGDNFEEPSLLPATNWEEWLIAHPKWVNYIAPPFYGGYDDPEAKKKFLEFWEAARAEGYEVIRNEARSREIMQKQRQESKSGQKSQKSTFNQKAEVGGKFELDTEKDISSQQDSDKSGQLACDKSGVRNCDERSNQSNYDKTSQPNFDKTSQPNFDKTSQSNFDKTSQPNCEKSGQLVSDISQQGVDENGLMARESDNGDTATVAKCDDALTESESDSEDDTDDPDKQVRNYHLRSNKTAYPFVECKFEDLDQSDDGAIVNEDVAVVQIDVTEGELNHEITKRNAEENFDMIYHNQNKKFKTEVKSDEDQSCEKSGDVTQTLSAQIES